MIKQSEHGRGANEFSNIFECKVENSFIRSGNACFFKYVNYIFGKDFTKDYFELIQSHKKK